MTRPGYLKSVFITIIGLFLTLSNVIASNSAPEDKPFPAPSDNIVSQKIQTTNQNNLNKQKQEELTLVVSVSGKTMIIDLLLNKRLISKNYTLALPKDGKFISEPAYENIDDCHYIGQIRGKPQSWAAISTCHGVRGIIYNKQQKYYLEPKLAKNSDILKYYLFNLNDHKTYHKKNPKRNEVQVELQYNKIEASEIMSKDSPNYELELALVADYGLYQHFGESVTQVRHYLEDLANILYAIFIPAKIQIKLVGIEIWSEKNIITYSESIANALKELLKYNKEFSAKIPNDNVQVITYNLHRSKFLDYYGITNQHSVCSTNSVGINVYHESISVMASSVAHEISHAIGTDDDNSLKCFCPDKQCIMHASRVSHSPPLTWSSCSMNFFNRLKNKTRSCLKKSVK